MKHRFSRVMSITLSIVLLLALVPTFAKANEPEYPEILLEPDMLLVSGDLSEFDNIFEMPGEHEELPPAKGNRALNPDRSGAHYFDFLSQAERAAYVVLEDAVRNKKMNVKLDLSAPIPISNEATKAFQLDYPIWARQYKYLYYKSSSNTITGFQLQFAATTPTQSAVDNERAMTEAAASVFLNGINAQSTEAQKVRIIHDNLVNLVQYDYDNYLAGTIPEASYTIYGALVNRSCVCEGYAKAFKYLVNLAGIDCYYISGLGNGGLHAWNIVKINNVWYDIDVTWDDPVGSTPILSYNYFCIPTATMNSDHTRDTSGLFNQLPISSTVINTSDFAKDSDFTVSASGILEKYNGPGGKISVPASVNGTKILSLGNYSFQNQRSVTSIILPDELTTITGYAFYNCTSLKTVDIPSSVNSISNVAFLNSPNVTIRGIAGSYAESYAAAYSMQFVAKGNIVIGDINGDGYITNVDLTILRQYFANSQAAKTIVEANIAATDINGDGAVTNVDLTILRQYFANSQNAKNIIEIRNGG